MIPFSLRTGLIALLLPLTLTACATNMGKQCPAPTAQQQCPACPVCPGEKPEQPAEEPLQKSSWDAVPAWSSDDHAAAWPALRQSCSTLRNRAEWRDVCTRADSLGTSPSRQQVKQFFEQNFTPWQAVNADGNRSGLVTGYFEPLIQGSRNPSPVHRWPIHAPPSDMITVDLGDQQPDLRHMRLRGRLVEQRLVPYWSRAEIMKMEDALPANVLFWAADPIDLFFLQVQGSGQIQLDDGTRARIGYADQNGHPYNSIGRWLVDRGELPLNRASMQGIRQWANENPTRLNELLGANPSYVFFRELPASNDGPLGALGVPLTSGRSIAIDPRFIPLGAPVFLDTTHPLSDTPLQRLMVAQDTGGAIKGAVRADFYWGPGQEAGEQAGRMRQQGRMWVLLPKGMTPPEGRKP